MVPKTIPLVCIFFLMIFWTILVFQGTRGIILDLEGESCSNACVFQTKSCSIFRLRQTVRSLLYEGPIIIKASVLRIATPAGACCPPPKMASNENRVACLAVLMM